MTSLSYTSLQNRNSDRPIPVYPQDPEPEEEKR